MGLFDSLPQGLQGYLLGSGDGLRRMGDAFLDWRQGNMDALAADPARSIALGVAGGGVGAIRSVGSVLPGLEINGARSVMPAPQRWLDPLHPEFKPGLGQDYTPGGRYLEMPSKTDITGQTAAAGSISTGTGRPSFKIGDPADAPLDPAAGPQVRTNLFKQSAGWKWLGDGAPQTDTLVSVESGGKHYYTLNADYPHGVLLNRFADAPSEPRLRPTGRGDLDLGQQIGTISVRGTEHPVYDRVRVISRSAGGE